MFFNTIAQKVYTERRAFLYCKDNKDVVTGFGNFAHLSQLALKSVSFGGIFGQCE